MLEPIHPDLRRFLSRIGKRGAAQRRVAPGACAICGAPFTGLSRRRYCSAACRLKASRRQRHIALGMASAAQGTSAAEAIRPLVARLDATATAIARGRRFEDSAAAIREARAERDEAMSGA